MGEKRKVNGLNQLYFSDCLKVLMDFHKTYPKGFIDLVYIDPPFNSKRDYNILFESIDMKDTKAQKEAFSDTWSNVSYLDSLNEIQSLDLDLYNFLSTLDNIRISKGAISYLTTMAIRIYYIHKVLKDTGSFYLHCDSTMSHYLKLVCDLIFGENNFKNNITWVRTNAHNFKANYYAKVDDTIFFYTKSNQYCWNNQYTSYSQEQLKRYKKEPITGRLYKAENLTMTGGSQSRNFNWRGSQPPANRVWGYSLEKLEELWRTGLILTKQNGSPRLDGLKVYLDDLPGKLLGNVWGDIDRVGNTSDERLGYPTQKPEELLERIIKSSSNEGDIIADFFCGCGTAIAVAQRLNRKWIGVDISHLAIKLIIDRLTKPYGEKRAKVIRDSINVTGFPSDVDGAKMLARETDKGRFGFQDWIIEVMLGGISNLKKTADGGYDGYLPFLISDEKNAKKGMILIEVKSGNINVKNIREFIQVIEKQKANLGVFVCFAEQVTKPMLMEAKQAGYFENQYYTGKYDKIQILTVEDLLNGKDIALPYRKEAFKTATKKLDFIPEQPEFF